MSALPTYEKEDTLSPIRAFVYIIWLSFIIRIDSFDSLSLLFLSDGPTTTPPLVDLD